MTNLKRALLATSSVFVLAGCPEIVEEEPEVLIDMVDNVSCSNDTFTFGADVGGGWTSQALLDIAETDSTDPWTEIGHEMPSVDFGEDEATGELWDRLELSLDSVYPEFDDVVLGDTTLFNCDWVDGSTAGGESLRYALRIFDEAGEYVDCAIWGTNADEWYSQDLSDRPGCEGCGDAGTIDYSICVDFGG